MAEHSDTTPKSKTPSRRKGADKPYSSAKKAIRQSLEKHRGKLKARIEPDMAIEVLDKSIHKIKPVEQALVTEHLFRKAIEASIPVGISGFDMQGRQIYVNRVFCEMVGFAQAELLGKRFPQPYWPAETTSKVRDDIEYSAKTILGSKGLEIRFQHKNGERFWGLVQGNVLIDGHGETRGHLISVANIDHQKQIEQTLKILSTKLISAQETERKLVAQDIHDGIGGRLAGIKYSIEKVLFEVRQHIIPEESALKEITSQVQSAIVEAQKITRNLHPSVLDDLGLFSAIQAFCREYQEVYSDIRIRLFIDMNEKNLPEPLKILIYRVCQEALNNIAKHSGADNVDLSIEQGEDTITLNVCDNGRGFNLEQVTHDQDPASGMGLQSMRERTELFGGSLNIDTRPEKGTVVTAVWPCRYPQLAKQA